MEFFQGLKWTFKPLNKSTINKKSEHKPYNKSNERPKRFGAGFGLSGLKRMWQKHIHQSIVVIQDCTQRLLHKSLSKAQILGRKPTWAIYLQFALPSHFDVGFFFLSKLFRGFPMQWNSNGKDKPRLLICFFFKKLCM